jgi:hypothetical protein
MKFLKKSALALAVAASVASIPAMAAEYGFSTGAEKIAPNAKLGTVVLANVIFGEGNPGTGSEETLINAPSVLFDLTNGGVDAGDLVVLTNVATVKYTLGGDAVFGEDLSTTALLDASNGTLGAFDVVSTGAVSWEVVQGGAIGDNTITIEITGTAAENLETLVFEGYKVKRLTSALKASSTDPRVYLGVEYVESVGVADDADDVASTATGSPIVIFASQEPLELASPDVTDFTATPWTRINVGNGEKTFTGGLGDGRKDFDVTGDTTYVELGSIQLSLQDIDTVKFPAADIAGSAKIKKENGDAFDFQGGDEHVLTVSATDGMLQEDGRIYLVPTASTCAAEVNIPNLINEAADIDSDGVATLELSGTTTALTTEYKLCYSVDGAAKIPEATAIDAVWTVDFFNSRYDNRDLESETYGALKRNGCIASFFNVPGVGENDTAFIRLTNTSSTNSGPVIATVYAQDGSVVKEDKEITSSLAMHATQVYTTLGASTTNAYGQDLLSLAETLEIDGDAAEYKGRARVVLKGAFDTCEGLGLIKSGTNGSLINLTSTTQGNGEGEGGNNGN